MENKKLIKRLNSKIDRRAVTIRIKPLGKKLQPQIEQAIAEANAEVLDTFTEDELVLFKQYIAKIINSVESIENS
jgi:DNA-binding MarR family transcriptional regulator